jgi:hypothetical protein
MKPMLAIAALAVALAGCSTPPAGTLAPQAATPAASPRVQLDVQSLGKGTITASRLTTEAGQVFEIDRPSVTNYVVFIVPKDTILPEGARIVRYLNDANGDGVYPGDEVTYEEPADYTHFVYRFDRLRDDEIAWMQVSFKAEGYEADGLVTSSYYDIIATHRFGEEADRNAMPFLRFAPDAPATLHFAGTNYETDAFETYETLNVDAEAVYDTYKTHRFELDLSLTTQDDKPLLGLTKENIDLRHFVLSPFDWHSGHPQLELANLGDGNYTLGIDFRHQAVPTAVEVALRLRNTPMIRDVEY